MKRKWRVATSMLFIALLGLQPVGAESNTTKARLVTGMILDEPDLFRLVNGRTVEIEGEEKQRLMQRLSQLGPELPEALPVTGERRTGHYVIQVEGREYLIRPYQFKTRTSDKVSCDELRLSFVHDTNSTHGVLSGCINE